MAEETPAQRAERERVAIELRIAQHERDQQNKINENTKPGKK